MEPLDFTAALDRARTDHLAAEHDQQRERQVAQGTLREVMGRLRKELVRRHVAREMKTFAAGVAVGDALNPGMRVVQGGGDVVTHVVEDVQGWDIPVGVVLAAINPSFEETGARPQHIRYSGLTLWLPEFSDRFGAHDSYSGGWGFDECGGRASAEIPTWLIIPRVTLARGEDGQRCFAVIVNGRCHRGPNFDEVLIAAAARLLA